MPPDDRLMLEWLPGRYAVCRLAPDAAVRRWVSDDSPAGLLSITRTDRELSIVIDESLLHGGAEAESDMSKPIQRGFRALRITGTLDFNLVGVLARLTAALADADISVFVISTYDTDLLLVREADVVAARVALERVARPTNLRDTLEHLSRFPPIDTQESSADVIRAHRDSR